MSTFHFLRPDWLWLLLPCALLWWAMLRRSDAAQAWKHVIAPHLLPHLLTGEDRVLRFGPVQLAGILWVLTIISLSGPAWRREPSPFAQDIAPLAVVLRVSPTMKTEDLQPDRLTRSKQKMHDLLQERPGTKASLVAYSGSAHLVMPPTIDSTIIDNFAEALEPGVMPMEGDAASQAMKLGQTSLESVGGGGSIVWITDSISLEQEKLVAEWKKNASVSPRILAPLPPGQDYDRLKAAAGRLDIPVTPMTPDLEDVERLARDAQFVTAGDQLGDRWRESGYWLTPVILLAALFFFRKGWVISVATGAGR